MFGMNYNHQPIDIAMIMHDACFEMVMVHPCLVNELLFGSQTNKMRLSKLRAAVQVAVVEYHIARLAASKITKLTYGSGVSPV